MNDENEFHPRLGRPKRQSLTSKRYAHQVRAAINRAGGRTGRKSKFTGSRIGRVARQSPSTGWRASSPRYRQGADCQAGRKGYGARRRSPALCPARGCKP